MANEKKNARHGELFRMLRASVIAAVIGGAAVGLGMGVSLGDLAGIPASVRGLWDSRPHVAWTGDTTTTMPAAPVEVVVP